jgi:hypothetical protein
MIIVTSLPKERALPSSLVSVHSQALRKILEKYMTWAGGPKPFHGPTNYFLSHAWSYKLGDLRDMV